MNSNAYPFAEGDTHQTVQEKFEQIATRYPVKVAITAEKDTITYFQLNHKAARLSEEITKELREDQSTIAAVFRDVKNSIGLAITYLASMKAGKVCLSLNSSERIEGDLLYAKPPLVITDSENIAAVERLKTADWKPITWNVDQLRHTMVSSTQALNLVQCGNTLDEPSFVFFTSGTAGPPKGVIITHRRTVTQARSVGQVHDVTTDDVITCFRNNSAGLDDMFIGLQNGMRVSTCDIFSKESLERLGDWINEEGVTIFRTVSSAYKYTVRSGKMFPKVRIVDIGGEMVTPLYFQAFKELFPTTCRFRPRYSSTETGIIAYGDLDHESELGDLIPYSFPLPHNEIFIFDENRKQLQPGSLGEIAVKSSCVALGYWNDPELTRVRFVPVESDPSKRIYPTRDRGYIRPGDGCLFITGKIDLAADRAVPDKVTRKLREG